MQVSLESLRFMRDFNNLLYVTDKEKGGDITPGQIQLLLIINLFPGQYIYSTPLADFCGISLANMYRYMKFMYKHGYIDKVSPGRYMISDKGREFITAFLSTLEKKQSGPFQWSK